MVDTTGWRNRLDSLENKTGVDTDVSTSKDKVQDHHPLPRPTHVPPEGTDGTSTPPTVYTTPSSSSRETKWKSIRSLHTGPR